MNQFDLFGTPVQGEDIQFLRRQLITYIGNKRRLLDLIRRGYDLVMGDMGQRQLRVLDLFAGSGVVSRFSKQYATHLHSNDFETYSQIINSAALSNRSETDAPTVRAGIIEIDRITSGDLRAGFITRLYSPNDEENIRPTDRVFYTRRNAMYIDTARQVLEGYPEPIRQFALASLIQKASVHANTSGVFKGFYKDSRGIGKFGGQGADALTRILQPIRLEPPLLSRFECSVAVTCRAAEDLVEELDESFDVAYIDPPYNQHPYGSNYFMLNLIASYEEPKEYSRVSGIPKVWKRSAFNKRPSSEAALFHTIEKCPAKFVILSYNCEGFVNLEDLIPFLERLGTVQVLDQKYNTFRGCRNLVNRDPHVTEYLFVLKRGDR